MRNNIYLLKWFNFSFGLILYAPVAILYFQRVTGSYALGMSVFSMVMVSAALFEVPTGIFSDLIGRKRTVVLGAWAATLATIFYAVGANYGVLLMGAVCEGLSRAFFSGNNTALLHDTLEELGEEKEFHGYLGRSDSMEQLALAISSLLGGFIAVWSFSAVVWLSVIPKIACVIIASRFREPQVKMHESTNVYAHLREAVVLFVTNSRLRMLSVASILSFGIGESIFTFRAVFVQTVWPLWAVGFSNTISNLGGAVSMYFSGKVIKRFSSLKILIATNIYNRSISFIALLFPSVLSPFLLSSTSFLFGIKQVAETELLQKEFTSSKRATMGSLNSLAGSLFFTMASFTLGALADHWGVVVALVIAHTCLIPVIVLHWWVFRGEGVSKIAI